MTFLQTVEVLRKCIICKEWTEMRRFHTTEREGEWPVYLKVCLKCPAP